MPSNNFINNLRFLKEILPYNIFYQLISDKDKYKKITLEKKNNKSLLLIEDYNTIEFKYELTAIDDYQIAVFSSFFSYIVFSDQLKEKPDLSIIFTEKLNQLGNLFYSLDLNLLIKNKDNIFFIFSKTDVEYIINFLTKNPSFLQKPAINFKISEYDKIFCENSRLSSYFSEKFNDLLIDYSTHQIMLPKQIVNAIENFKYIKSTIQFNFNEDIFVIAISAGPSLNSSIEKIKMIKDRVFIIAVDTALKLLLKNNIVPDIIVVLDPQVLNFLDFAGISNLDKSILAIEISSSFKIAQKFQDNKKLSFFAGLLPEDDENNKFLPVNPLTLLMSKVFSLTEIPVFGNVGLAAISVASKISNKIILAGFDNSFSSLIYHCKETIDIDYSLKNQSYSSNALSRLIKDSLSRIDFSGQRTSLLLERNAKIFEKYFPDKHFYFINEIQEDFQDNFKQLNKDKLVKIYRVESNIAKDLSKIKSLIVKFIDESFKDFPLAKKRSIEKINNSLNHIF